MDDVLDLLYPEEKFGSPQIENAPTPEEIGQLMPLAKLGVEFGANRTSRGFYHHFR